MCEIIGEHFDQVVHTYNDRVLHIFQIAFVCVLLVDDGSTMITRALRVNKEYEGLGVTRTLKKHVERIFHDFGVLKKAMTFADPVLFEKIQRENKPIVFKKVILLLTKTELLFFLTNIYQFNYQKLNCDEYIILLHVY